MSRAVGRNTLDGWLVHHRALSLSLSLSLLHARTRTHTPTHTPPHTHTHTHTNTLHRCCMSFGLWGNLCSTQTQGEHANSTEKPPCSTGTGNRDLLTRRTLIMLKPTAYYSINCSSSSIFQAAGQTTTPLDRLTSLPPDASVTYPDQYHAMLILLGQKRTGSFCQMMEFSFFATVAFGLIS